MLRIAVITLSLIAVVACGQISRETPLPTPEDTNLFELASNSDQVVHKNSLFGLWESNVYSQGQVLKQIRWQISENRMTLAKKCTRADGSFEVAQVSAKVEVNAEGHEDEFSLTAQINTMVLADEDVPEPVIVTVDDSHVCSVQITQPLNDGEIYLRDSEFSFSAFIVDGRIDMNISVDPSVAAPAMIKISDN